MGDAPYLRLRRFFTRRSETRPPQTRDAVTDAEMGRQRVARVEIRPLGEDDLVEVVALEQEVYPLPWSRACFRNELSRPYSHLHGLCEAGSGLLVGYICFWILYNEMHVLNLAVKPSWRGRGLGKLLLNHALDEARGQEVSLVSLEVRVSNEVAINLYHSVGFRRVGVRPNYYSPEREDALLMQLDMS
jgi:ribosomal-protein-alanine N-acetyltransferase